MTKNCMVCGKFARQEICDRCKELQRLRHELSDTKDALRRREAQISSMRMYQVHTNTVWINLTWDEALRKAEELRGHGVSFLFITDEHQVRLYAYDREGGHFIRPADRLLVTP